MKTLQDIINERSDERLHHEINEMLKPVYALSEEMRKSSDKTVAGHKLREFMPGLRREIFNCLCESRRELLSHVVVNIALEGIEKQT